jgi:hypothetical protein
MKASLGGEAFLFGRQVVAPNPKRLEIPIGSERSRLRLPRAAFITQHAGSLGSIPRCALDCFRASQATPLRPQGAPKNNRDSAPSFRLM